MRQTLKGFGFTALKLYLAHGGAIPCGADKPCFIFPRFSPCLSRRIPLLLWQPLENCSAVQLELCLCNFVLFSFPWIWEFQMRRSPDLRTTVEAMLHQPGHTSVRSATRRVLQRLQSLAKHNWLCTRLGESRWTFYVCGFWLYVNNVKS